MAGTKMQAWCDFIIAHHHALATQTPRLTSMLPARRSNDDAASRNCCQRCLRPWNWRIASCNKFLVCIHVWNGREGREGVKNRNSGVCDYQLHVFCRESGPTILANIMPIYRHKYAQLIERRAFASRLCRSLSTPVRAGHEHSRPEGRRRLLRCKHPTSLHH